MALWMLSGIAFGSGMLILRSVMYFLDALLDELLTSKANYAQSTARASCEQERLHVCMCVCIISNANYAQSTARASCEQERQHVCMYACMHAGMYLCMYVHVWLSLLFSCSGNNIMRGFSVVENHHLLSSADGPRPFT